jgi:hypothetical protein
MIELIMAVGSLLLVLGVFSVIVKTYLEEFSEGTLSERKWADVQTFFTYVNRDIEELRKSLGTEETLEINTNGTIEIKSSDGTVTDSVVYSIDDSTGEISRNGTVIIKANKNFDIDGLELRVYENALAENSINSSWEYEVSTGDTVEIGSEATSNYYIEPVISLTDGSEITGGYALRFDNVVGSTTDDGENDPISIIETEVSDSELGRYYSFDGSYYYEYIGKDSQNYNNYYGYEYKNNKYKYDGQYYDPSGSYFDESDYYTLKLDVPEEYIDDTGKVYIEVEFSNDNYEEVEGISYYDGETLKWVKLIENDDDTYDEIIKYESEEENIKLDDTIMLKFFIDDISDFDGDDVTVVVKFD